MEGWFCLHVIGGSFIDMCCISMDNAACRGIERFGSFSTLFREVDKYSIRLFKVKESDVDVLRIVFVFP